MGLLGKVTPLQALPKNKVSKLIDTSLLKCIVLLLVTDIVDVLCFRIASVLGHVSEGVGNPNSTAATWPWFVLTQCSKQCWVVLTQIWVKYGQTQMLGYKCNLNFNPTSTFTCNCTFFGNTLGCG